MGFYDASDWENSLIENKHERKVVVTWQTTFYFE